MPQRTKEWYDIRLGKITGTRLKDVMKPDNLGVIDAIIAESVTKESPETFVNSAMQWGIDHEDEARALYEKENKIKLDVHGFIESETFSLLGMSPDGMSKLGTKKYIHGIEIKCPNTSTHVKNIRQNQLPNDYKYQVYAMYLINPNLQTHDFISYDPRFHMKPLFVFRTTREMLKDDLLKTEELLAKFLIKHKEYYSEIVKF
jgi:putative phage-type endonuclease